MVATKGENMGGTLGDLFRGQFDLRDRLLYPEWCARDVAGVRNLARERLRLSPGVEWT